MSILQNVNLTIIIAIVNRIKFFYNILITFLNKIVNYLVCVI